MEPIEILGIIISIIFLVLIAIGMFNTAISNYYETININTLNNICKKITHNESAIYFQELGPQKRFPCMIDNNIIIYGTEN